MILSERIKRQYKKRNCKCDLPKREVKITNNYDEENYDGEENYDNENTFDNASTLEEHFENFGEAVGEVAENFLRGRQARKIAKANKLERIKARQEKRMSRIKGRQTLREKRVESKLKELESAPETKEQAETQAQQVNQLASAVQPQSAPISAVETPTGSGSSSEQLYKTLPMGNEAPQQSGLTGLSAGSTGTEEEANAQQDANEKAETKELTAEIKPESAKKKSSKTLYLIIGLVAVVGIYFFMKKKK